MPIAFLPERGVIKVEGADARTFLHGLITCDIGKISPEKAGFGALLSPQGKIIADFLICEVPDFDGGGFFLDCFLTRVSDLMKRLKLYKLRADVVITDMTEKLAVLACWEKSKIHDHDGLVFNDPRAGSLGQRAIVERRRAEELSTASAKAYHIHRIALGVPDGGKDFAYEDVFPHEALMDQLGGVDFRKGCYVGQEVVSRMEHRGTVRTRIVSVLFEGGFVCEWGIAATAGGKLIGRMGSTGKGRGLALLRLDKVRDALATGIPLMAGGLTFAVEPAALARFAPLGEAPPAA